MVKRREGRAKKQRGRPCTLEAEGCHRARDNLLSFRLPPSTTATTAAAPTRLPLCTALFHRTPDIDCPRLSPSRYNNSVENDFPTGRIARQLVKREESSGERSFGEREMALQSVLYMASEVNVWTEFKMWVRKFD